MQRGTAALPSKAHTVTPTSAPTPNTRASSAAPTPWLYSPHLPAPISKRSDSPDAPSKLTSHRLPYNVSLVSQPNRYDDAHL
eukprot:684127-Rhodomonas_salina.1